MARVEGPTPHLQKSLLIRAMAGDRRLTKTEFRVAIALLAHHNPKLPDDHRNCFPSFETLAEDIGVQTITKKGKLETSRVKKAVKGLIKKGWFEKEAGGGRGHSNDYRPVLELMTDVPIEDLQRVTLASPFMLGEPMPLVRAVRPRKGDETDVKGDETVVKGDETDRETVVNSSPEGRVLRKEVEGGKKRKAADAVSPSGNFVAGNPDDGAGGEAMSERSATAAGFAGEVARAFEAFQDFARKHDLPVPSKYSETRRKNLTARLRDAGGLDGFRRALDRIAASPGLLGKNDRGWKASFTWLLQQESFLKLTEGDYDGWGDGKDRAPDGLDRGVH